MTQNQGFPWYKEKKAYVKGFLTSKNYLNKIKKENELLNEIKGIEEVEEFNDFISSVNGFFNIILDLPAQTIASVDRVSSMPLFYSYNNGDFLISDSVQWLKSRVNPICLDEVSKEEYLMTGYVTGANTLYSPIKQLQAGEYIIYDKNKNNIQLKRYYSFEHSTFSEKNDFDLAEQLDTVYQNTFKRLINSLEGRPVVLPLSGGHDSRLIAFMLKRLGYRNVTCFTYGKHKSSEVAISKSVAEYLGYKWIFIPYTKEKWNQWITSEEMEGYLKLCGGLRSLPIVQDWPAVMELKTKKLVPENSVFIPGHTGDFIVGDHIPEEFERKNKITSNDIVEAIFQNHYNLWTIKNKQKNILKEKIYSVLSNYLNSDEYYSSEEAANIFELWEWQERQAKFICNSVKIYEYFGYEWRMPLWDNEIMNFWSKIKVENRINRRLYFLYVKYKQPYPYLEKESETKFTKLKKIVLRVPKIFKLLYSIKNNKILEYENHPLAWYGIITKKSYGNYLIHGAKNFYSIWGKEYLNKFEKNK